MSNVLENCINREGLVRHVFANDKWKQARTFLKVFYLCGSWWSSGRKSFPHRAVAQTHSGNTELLLKDSKIFCSWFGRGICEVASVPHVWQPHLLTGVSSTCAVLMNCARKVKVSSCRERENPFLFQLMLHILLWWHSFLSSSERGHPGTLGERERKEALDAVVCHVLKPPSGGWCFLRSRKVSTARSCHPAQGTPVNKLQEHRNSFPLFHLSLIAFLNLPPCEVSLGWCGTFHLARRGGGFPWYTQRKRDMVVCHFFSIWKDRAERRWGRWVWPASKESKAKWRNTGVEEPSLSSIIKRFHWDTSKQKALISSGISRYRKTTEELGQSWADLPTAWGGTGKCSCPWDEGCLCIPWSICSDVIGSGNQ